MKPLLIKLVWLLFTVLLPLYHAYSFQKEDSVNTGSNYLENTKNLIRQRAPFDSVMYHANKALEYFRSQNDTIQMGACYLYICQNHLRAGKFKIALELLDSLHNYSHPYMFENEVSKNNMVRYYWYKGACLSDLGRNKDAISHFEIYTDTVALLEGENINYLSAMYNSHGVLLRGLDLYDQAAELYQKALKISRPQDRNIMLSNIGSLYSRMRLFDKALEFYNKGLEEDIKTHGIDAGNTKDNYLNIGGLYLQMGDYDKALLYYLKTEIPSRKDKVKYYYLSDYYVNIAAVYQKRKEYLKAAHNFVNATNVYLEKFDSPHPQLVYLYYHTGGAYLYADLPDSANYYYNKALNLPEDVLKNARPEHIFYLYLNIHDYHKKLKNYDLAENYLEKGMALKNDLPFDNLADIYLYYGMLSEEKEENQQAFQYYQKSLITALKLPEKEETDPLVLPQFAYDYPPMEVIKAIGGKAQVLQKLYYENNNIDYLYASIQHYESEAMLIKKRRGKLRQDSEKKYLADSFFEINKKGVIMSYEANEHNSDGKDFVAKAFAFSEEAKNLNLKEKIQAASAYKHAGVPTPFLNKEKELITSLNFYKSLKKEADPKNTDLLNQHNEKILSLETAYDSLSKKLEDQYPQYYELIFTNDIINISEVQEKLSDNQTLIEYFLADSSIYTFVIDKNNYSLSMVNKPNKLDSTITAFRSALLQKNNKGYLESAFQLYDILINPIKDKIATSEVIIIPDSYLGYLPFEILVSRPIKDYENVNFKSLPYLINDYLISYQYSATIALKSKSIQNRDQNNDDLLAFAPSFDDRSTTKTELLAFNDTIRSNISELPGAAEEASMINSIFDGSLFIAENATETNFKKVVGKYNILHLATHAIIDDRKPSESKLIFTLKDSLDDGYLHAYELYGMHLNADLVTLSACNTGFGQIKKGEGVMSLARGFAYAGCPNIVMSLWPASDKATSSLMQYFYQNLSEGMNKDKALHEAKKEYIKSNNNLMAHPYYWGSFVFMGNNDSIKSGKRTLIIISLITALLIVGLLIKKKGLKK